MARTGATRRDTAGPLQAMFSRIQTNSAVRGAAPEAPDGRLTDGVIRSLGLHDQPFRPPGGQVPYFYNEHLEALLDELEACLGNGETLVILEGAAESGKTCTVAQLLERFYDGGHVFLSRAGAATTADSIVRSMLGAYRSTTPQTLEECTDQLIEHLAANAELGATSVLLVEDAERMPAAELQHLLTEIDTVNSQLSEPVSVLLTSSESAENLLSGLRSAHIEAGQVDAFAMPRLDANETASYIATRLAAAGHEGELPLDERELQVLTHNSNGLPGYVDRSAASALNQLVSRQQIHAILAPKQWWRATRQHFKWVVLGVSLLLLGLAAGAWNAQPADRGDTLVKSLPLPSNPGAGAVPEATPGVVASVDAAAVETPSVDAATVNTAAVAVEPIPTDTANTAEQLAAVSTAETVNAESTNADSVVAAAEASAEETASTLASTTETIGESPQSTELLAPADTRDDATESATEAPTPSASAAALDDSLAESTQATAADATASDDTQTVDAQVQTTETAATDPIASESTSNAIVTAAVEPAPAPQATNPLPNSVLSGVISGSKWIERRDPNRFTVQLLAGADEAALRLHARKHGMTSLSAIYRTLRNGEPWFALVHGDFSSSVEAREAVATLPEIWQQNSPWIRRFDDVQKAIN